jgi:L-asparaginase
MRLVLLHTGGTLVMSRGESGQLTPDAYAADVARELPVLAKIADIETRIVMNADSGDIQPDDWRTLARAVHDALSEPETDGVVMIHGTDTMAYTASALALMLGPLPKPVVLTGAQHPLSAVRTDARSNVIDACSVATLGVPEVVITFAGRALRGVRATKRDAWALDAFDTPTCAPLVDLGLGTTISPLVRAAGALAPLDDRLGTRVLAVRVFPGLDPAALLRALDAGVRGLVLEAYGTGNVPRLGGSLVPVIAEATARDVPVLVVSQCPRGFVELGRYEGGAAAEAAGAIAGGQMTVEAALAKTMVALGRHERIADVRAYLARDAVGEMG